MEKHSAEQFSREVDGYRRALLYHARSCEWEAFKAKAGGMFDYVESVEASELEKRFFRAFLPILAVLVAAVIMLVTMDLSVHPELLQYKNVFVLAALAASSFELYFYLNYRMYMQLKTTCYRKRREQFIRVIENDFRCYTTRPGDGRA